MDYQMLKSWAEEKKRLNDENKELKRQIELARLLIQKQADDLVDLEDDIEEINEQLQEDEVFARQIGALRGELEIMRYANEKLWNTNKKLLRERDETMAQAIMYKENFHTANTRLIELQKQNDHLTMECNFMYNKYVVPKGGRWD